MRHADLRMAQPSDARLSGMTMAKPVVKHTDIKDMTFERALKELETIVGRLERGDVELEESITIYERGEALKEHCDRLLKQAEAKVEKLTLGPSGVPTGTEPFKPQE
jgi:exodeoxyribonuclease VII small subunit